MEKSARFSKRVGALPRVLDFIDIYAHLDGTQVKYLKNIDNILLGKTPENDKRDKYLIELYEKAEFDKEFVIRLSKKFGNAGLQIHGYGSPGLTNTEALLLIMSICGLDASFGTFYLVHAGLAMASINIAGTSAQKAFWLPQMARMEKIGAFGLSEPDYGSNATGLQTSAKKIDRGWILNGTKRWIGNGTFADLIVIWARNSLTKGISGYIVEKGFKGVSTSKIDNKYALRIVQNANIQLDNVFVPDSHYLAAAENFQKGTEKVLETSRAMVVAAVAGSLVGAVDKALEYTLTHKQFDRPIASFQLAQEKLVRAIGLTQASVLTMLHLGKLLDKGTCSMKQIALAKAWCSRYGREGVSLCRELFGGNGIILDYGVMKAFMDMEAIYTYEGTYDINVLIAGRAITGLSAFL